MYDTEGDSAPMKRSMTPGAVIMLLPLILSFGSVSALQLFSEEPDWVYQLYTNSPCNLISATLIGDPLPDLVLSDSYSECIQTFVGNGDGSFELFQTISLTHTMWLETSDVDLDGDQDLLAICTQAGALHVFVMLNDGAGNLSTPISSYIDAGGENFVTALFDADTLPDIVVGNGSGNVYYSHGNGDGTFEEAQLIYDENYGAFALDVADLDSDGDLDIVLLAWHRLSVLFNNGDGTVTWGGEYYGPFAGPVEGGHLDIAHLDSDEFLDVIVSACEGMGTNAVFTFLGKGDGSFNITGPGWLDGVYFNQVIARDFDLNGYNDVFLCGTLCLAVMLNDGTGMLIEPIEFFNDDAASCQGAAADFDIDGDFDLAYVYHKFGSPWEIRVHLNRLIQQGVEGSEGTVNSIELFASPSPFSSNLGITYSLPESGHIELSIYDLSGRFRESVENCWKSAGTHSAIWTPEESIPGGCYFVVLDACGERVFQGCVKL